MGRYQDATARQLDFESDAHTQPFAAEIDRLEAPRPRPLCVVCGRHPARFTVAQHHGRPPAKLCLRCHHGVRQQRKMLRAELPKDSDRQGPTLSRSHHIAGDVGLIVTPGKGLSGEARQATLDHRRRRAQVAARRALSLDLLDCNP